MGDMKPETAATPEPAPNSLRIAKRTVFSWVLWDWATQPFHTLLVTFIWVSLYLVSDAFLPPEVAALGSDGKLDCAGADSASSYCEGLAKLSSDYGLITFFAGLVVLILAPALGQQADSRGKKKQWVVMSTVLLILLQFSLFFVEADPRLFILGAIIIALGSVASEIAGASYNAMLFDVSTPKNIGKISGLGWGSGYLGGIFALVIVIVVTNLNWFGMDTSNGMAYRLIAVGAGVWTLLFALPFLFFVPESPVRGDKKKVSFLRSYKIVVQDLWRIFKHHRTVFGVLISSAIYRDGIIGVFVFGAILASLTFGFTPTEVMLFGVALNIVAGLTTMLVGAFEDKVGARNVILGSLLLLIVCLLAIFFLRDYGKIVFWAGGLLIAATVGPAQSATRSLLSRLTPPQNQGEVFGMYATTGRAVSFLAPAAWTAAIGIFGSAHFGALGIATVLVIGLIAFWLMVPARVQHEVREAALA
ncbi:MFS transporter [Canibacter oris]|nr:MFS transporter [Canibacter oris]